MTVRLVGGVVALVVVLVGAVGTTTYLGLQSFLYTRLDQQLAPVADNNEGHIARCLASGADGCAFGGGPDGYRAPQTEWLTVLGSKGVPVIRFTSNEFFRLMSLSSALRSRIVDDAPTVRTLTTQGGARIRVRAHTVTVGENSFVVVTGLSTESVSKTLSRVVAIELIIGAAAVALALGATSWGVRRSLRNLYSVTGTAREVAAELSPTGSGLERRVPVTEQGTEVGQLAESMNTLLSAVETQFAARLQNEQRMRQFLADASHELRTPLTSIRGYAELARMQRAASGEVPQDNLDRIESEGTRMSRLVDDLLMLARGDATDMSRASDGEQVDVAELVDDAVSGSRAAFPGRPIEVEVDAGLIVLGDRDQLLRVLRNLVTNACVHTEVGRPVYVRGHPDANFVVVTVLDGGPGLPPEQAAHVFERFWRADEARTRTRGGTGLGMSIVASIVQAHGGTVRFDSSVAVGSTVTVRLPVATQ